MSILKKTGLTAVFILAADMAVAATTGMVGIHGLLVDGGASFGQAVGIPHVDWNLLGETGEFAFIEPGTDPHAGHNHGPVTSLSDSFSNSNPLNCENPHLYNGELHCGEHDHGAPQIQEDLVY